MIPALPRLPSVTQNMFVMRHTVTYMLMVHSMVVVLPITLHTYVCEVGLLCDLSRQCEK